MLVTTKDDYDIGMTTFQIIVMFNDALATSQTWKWCHQLSSLHTSHPNTRNTILHINLCWRSRRAHIQFYLVSLLEATTETQTRSSEYTPSALGTRVHIPLRHAGGIFKRTDEGCAHRKVAYTKHDVPRFVEWRTLGCSLHFILLQQNGKTPLIMVACNERSWQLTTWLRSWIVIHIYTSQIREKMGAG
jgi:hypothetical protein